MELPFGKSTHKGKYNDKIDLKETGWEMGLCDLYSSDSGLGHVTGCCKCGNEPTSKPKN